MSNEEETAYTKFKAYDYRANSNLVLQPETRVKTNEPTGEPESLAGKPLHKFGDRAERAKPPVIKRKTKPKKKKKSLLEGGDILTSTENFLFEQGYYQPRSEETAEAFEEMLHFIQPFIGDYPQDVIRNAADEVLATLKDEKMTDPERYKSIQIVLPNITQEDFAKLVDIGKQITDYTTGEGETIDDEHGVALNFEEESEEEELDYVRESESEDEEMGEEAVAEGTIGTKKDEMEVEEDKDIISARDIDAYWLQRELGKFYKEATQSQKLSEEILELLSSKMDDMSLENKLMLILDTDKFSLIKILLKNRHKIVYCTRLGRAKDDSERKKIEDEMMKDEGLRDILDELHGIQKKRKTERMEDKMEVEEELPTEQKTFLDLQSLVFEQGSHLMANKECVLPKGTVRNTYKGYEEVIVPPAELPPFKKDEKLVEIRELPKWAQPAFPNTRSLNRVQSRLYKAAMFKPDNLLLCAPTGAGKTNVAVLCILHQIGLHMNTDGTLEDKDFKIIYVAPMKALVQEVVGNLRTRFEQYGIQVGELTGDATMTRQQIEETQIIVTTPEKWDIVTRKSGDRTYVQQVKLIIIDEIHLLHDERGPVLECIVARTIRQQEASQENIRIVGLSATLPNYKDVAHFLRVKSENIFFFDNSYRPVPLQQQYIGITERKGLKRVELMNRLTYEKVIEKAGIKQVLVFVHSRKETYKTAKAIREMAIEGDTIAKFISDQSSREILRSEAENIKNKDLKELLPYGFGIHHAGLSRNDRSLVEDLFYGGHLQVLVSTATLAWGVNLPAHTVIIKGTQVYSPEKGRWTELSPLDIMQMIGRAGRPKFDKEGEGIVITTQQELQYYLSLLNQQLPIESQFIKQLADNLNGEIVLGTISNLTDAVNWLGYTYLYVRMVRNPTLYGISVDEIKNDPHLVKRRTDLIHTAASILDKHNLIKYDRKSGVFQVTDLGRVASHYYIPHESIAIYNEHLKPSMNDIELFRLFSLSQEFKYMQVRREEKLELQKLLERVPIPVKESVEEGSAKVNVLFQAYISKLKLEGFALIADMTYITQSAARIMRALFEIVLRRGWAQLAERTLNLAKMVEKRVWKSQSPLRQFNALPEETIKRLEKKDLSWDRLYDLSPAELGNLVRYPKIGKTLYKYIHQFPRLDLTAHVLPITRSMLRIDLTITPDFQWSDKAHGGAEAFWVMVQDVDGENILHYEMFILQKRFAEDEHYITFTVPITEPLPPQYFIKVINDRWLNSETILPVSFRHLILPERYPEPTDLLDLQPLPINAVRNEKYMSLFEFKQFNPIQTQVFNAIYNSDENVFVGAPTGSGKTVIAELAILRCFNQTSDKGSIVYIAPLESLAEQRFRDWSKKFEELDKMVTLLTGDINTDLKLMQQADIIISTPEQWDIISRRWKIRKSVQNVKLFIVDELHLIGGEKGPVIEVICSRMRYISSQLQDHKLRIIGLSSSVANANDLGEWLGASAKKHTLFNFHPNVRPVPLEINIRGFENNSFTSRVLAMVKPTYHAVKQMRGEKPSIIFVPSRQQARFIALELITCIATEDDPKRYQSVKNLEAYKEHITSKAVANALEYGIGIYHSGLTEAEKKIIERLYESEGIKILVSTYNMAWGMDMTANTVIIMGTQYYDGKEHRYTDYSITDVLQMMGRATRPLVDDSGKCYIFCHAPKKEYYKKFLYEPFPVESHFDHFLADHMNAEIVTKTIVSKQDAVDYLTWTFLYRRLRQNPNYYNLHGTTHHHLSDYLSELVENTLNDLATSKCIAIEDYSVSPMNLGMIASYYYIKFTTIDLYSSSLTSTTKLRGLIEILSASSEFDDIPIRSNEEEILSIMAKHLPLRIEKPKYTDPHTKVNILLQSHFSRTKLNDELEHDKAIILEQSTRLIQAMVDVIASNGYLSPAIAAMELSQMITQAMWDRDSVFMQLPYFDKKLCDKCKEVGLESIFDLIEMDDEKRDELLQLSEDEMSDVAAALNRYPNIEIDFEVLNSDQIKSGDPVTLVLQFDVEELEDTPVHAPYFPKDRQEEWWIIVGDQKTNSLAAIKRLPIKKKFRTKLEFMAPKEGHYNYKLYIICDSYFGIDQEYDFELNVKEAEDVEMQD